MISGTNLYLVSLLAFLFAGTPWFSVYGDSSRPEAVTKGSKDGTSIVVYRIVDKKVEFAVFRSGKGEVPVRCDVKPDGTVVLEETKASPLLLSGKQGRLVEIGRDGEVRSVEKAVSDEAFYRYLYDPSIPLFTLDSFLKSVQK